MILSKTSCSRHILLFGLVLTGLLFPAKSHAITTWLLDANFSSTSNPPATGLGAAWSYRNLSGNLFSTFTGSLSSPLWSGVLLPSFNQNRWTDSATANDGFGIAQGSTNGTMSWPIGAPGGVAYDIRWTAPYTTTITVTADVWMMRTTTNVQTLDVNLGGVDQGIHNIPLTSGPSQAGGTPYTIATAYGASFLQGTAVTAGETLDFFVAPASTFSADFVGIDFRVDAADQTQTPPPTTPEPATMGFMVSGLGAIAFFLRRRKA